jgi:hypothetical protein
MVIKDVAQFIIRPVLQCPHQYAYGPPLPPLRHCSDLKQTRQQRYDDGYSHNAIPHLVQKK